MSDVIEVFKDSNDNVLKVKLNGVEIKKENVRIALPPLGFESNTAVLELKIERDNVRVVIDDE